jgi:Holliday junction resolvase-like predicted endonuclease
MSASNITVIKATGEKEGFSEEKVRSSIRRAWISSELEGQVVEHVKSILYENIPTNEVYQHIIEFLDKSPQPVSAAKYSLKRAIMELGPSGYPFEKFLAAVLKHHGYSVEINQIVQGKCVSHEVDIIAEKDKNRFMVEAKFHKRPGIRSSIKDALYTWARFNDLKDFTQSWLATNTKVTSDAINYAKCMQMHIISWSYPNQGNLRDLVQSSGLQPITTLVSLTQKQKSRLLDENIVLCRSIHALDNKRISSLGLLPEQLQKLKKEAEAVCS